MTAQTNGGIPLAPPKDTTAKLVTEKVQRALEVRESSAKAREGRPLAFPTQRVRH